VAHAGAITKSGDYSVRPPSKLPRRLPEGTKYVVESAGAYVRRFVELPGGKRIILPKRMAAPIESASIIPDQNTEISSVDSDAT